MVGGVKAPATAAGEVHATGAPEASRIVQPMAAAVDGAGVPVEPTAVAVNVMVPPSVGVLEVESVKTGVSVDTWSVTVLEVSEV